MSLKAQFGSPGVTSSLTGIVRSRWSDLLAAVNPPPTTLADARSDGAAVALEADGYSLLLTCPARMVVCEESALRDLLADLAALRSDHATELKILFERLQPSDYIWSPQCPCCAAPYTGELWLHGFFAPFDLKASVQDVLAARVARVPWSTEALLERAHAAQPLETKWPLRLLSIYAARMNAAAGEERIAWAARALEQCDRVLRANPEAASPESALVAFEAGAYTTAEAYAHRLLRDAWRRMGSCGASARPWGRRVCDAHSVLGRIALRAGDTPAAEHHLIESALAPLVLTDEESPDFTLAAELTAAGETAALPQFLSLSRIVWKRGLRRLAEWLAELDRGGTPSFDLAGTTA